MAGCGALAAAAGVGLAVYQRGTVPSGASADLLLPGAVQALWDTRFETILGQILAMQSLRGKPLLLNFWATWCPPCVEEFPLLDAFYRQNMTNGMQVLGLAIDKPEAVKAFLQKLPVSFPVAMASSQGTDLVRNLGNSSGGLPFSLLFAPSGAVLRSKLGKLAPGDLTDWATAHAG